MPRKPILFLSTWLLLFFSLSLQASLLDPSRDQTLPIGLELQYLHEDTEPLGVDAVRTALADAKFTASESSYLNFGIAAPAVWLSLQINNLGDVAQSRTLSLETSWLDSVDVYFLHNNQFQTRSRRGDAQPRDGQVNSGRFFDFAHDYPAGQTQVFIRIETPDPMVLPIYLREQAVLDKTHTLSSYRYGFLYGAMLALLVYNLVLGLSLKSARYSYYALYIFSFVAMNMGYTGHGYSYLWPNSPELQGLLIPALMMIYNVTGLIFAAVFLNTKRTFPKLHPYILGTCLVFATSIGLSVLMKDQVLALYLAFSYMLCFTVAMATLGILSLFGGHRLGRYFLCAALIGSGGAGVTGMTVWGLVPYNAYAYLAIELGMLVEAILLALALADQFRRAHNDKLKAQRMARIDPLTGLNNRRGFDEDVIPQWNSEHCKEDPMAIILLDIDHFKRINDRFGHSIGDSVLTELAACLNKHSRTSDTLARWGGEEFIIFLPATRQDEAVEVAERYRQYISQIEVDTGAHSEPLKITASFGVAQRESLQEPLDTLLNEADRYLYLAKKLGRNKVCADESISSEAATRKQQSLNLSNQHT